MQYSQEKYIPSYIEPNDFKGIFDKEGEIWSDKLSETVSITHKWVYDRAIARGARLPEVNSHLKRCFMTLEVFDELCKDFPIIAEKAKGVKIDYSFERNVERTEPYAVIIAKSPYRMKVKDRDQESRRQDMRTSLGLAIEYKDRLK